MAVAVLLFCDRIGPGLVEAIRATMAGARRNDPVARAPGATILMTVGLRRPHLASRTGFRRSGRVEASATAGFAAATRLPALVLGLFLLGAGGEKMELKSRAFEAGGMIPPRYTCDGEDISPPLQWSDPPAGTKSFALISDDPDAPVGTWVHWVVWNIPATARGLEENQPKKDSLPSGAKQGTTDFRRVGYGGPCPPSGTHRYFFKLYALDTTLSLPASTTKRDLEKAMQGHILAQAELMGRYRRR